MGILTATKIAIIAMSCNVPAHVCIDNSFYNHYFFIKKNKRINTRNKSAHGLERFNTSFHQKTFWVEEHCYELMHSNKTEMNILTTIIIIIH